MKLTIGELALKKDFSNLSFEEKQFVLSQITNTEYDNIRFLLTNSKECFKRDYDILEMNNIIRKNLSIAFKQKHKKEKELSVHIDFWNNYKSTIRPVLSVGIVLIATILVINYNSTNNNLSSDDINNVTLFLNEDNSLLKINEKHSSDLIDSNKFNKDSIIEMNNYLQIKSEGLYLN